MASSMQAVISRIKDGSQDLVFTLVPAPEEEVISTSGEIAYACAVWYACTYLRLAGCKSEYISPGADIRIQSNRSIFIDAQGGKVDLNGAQFSIEEGAVLYMYNLQLKNGQALQVKGQLHLGWVLFFFAVTEVMSDLACLHVHCRCILCSFCTVPSKSAAARPC